MEIRSNQIVSESISHVDIATVPSSESKDVIQSFLSDESKIISGNVEKVQKVFFPRTTIEVVSVLTEAASKQIHVTVSGAGTGLTGSRVAQDGWILATERLQEIQPMKNETGYFWTEAETNQKYGYSLLKTHENTTCIRIPVSMRLQTLQHLVRSLDLFYPPDTTERSSFIGGNVATNASGSRTFKYGPTRSYVQEVVVVLTTGMVLRLNREQMTDESYSWEIINQQTNEKTKIHVNKSFPNPKVSKNAVGFPIYPKMPLIELFIGTEGIFGVVTEVVLRLLPFPKNIFSLISYFETPAQAIEFVKRAQEQKFKNIEPIPMSVEYFDYYALQLVKKSSPKIPAKTQSAVYLEQDVSDPAKVDTYLEFWLEHLEEAGYLDAWAETEERGIEKHKEFRHSLPTGVHDVIKKNKVNKVGTDFAVPPAVFDKFLDLLQKTGEIFINYQKTRKEFGFDNLSFVIYGHIGNDHLHMNFLPRDQEELQRAEELYLEMAKEVITLGGTISAEHGVGKKKYGGKSYIWYMIGDHGIEELRALKKKFDPVNILNRGNIFD